MRFRPRAINRARAAQETLAKLFAPIDPRSLLSDLPDDTILCRCEGEWSATTTTTEHDRLTGREVKHNGRFAMGACQGGSARPAHAALMAEINPAGPSPAAEDLTGPPLAVRPVSMLALTGAIPRTQKTNDEVYRHDASPAPGAQGPHRDPGCRPFDGSPVAKSPISSSAEINAAVLRAKAAQWQFRRSTPAVRRAMLNALAAEVNADAGQPWHHGINEMGKTIREAREEAKVRRAQNTLKAVR